MNKKSKLVFFTLVIIGIVLIICFISNRKSEEKVDKANYLKVTVLTVSNDSITVRDGYNLIYTFDSVNDFELTPGETVVLEYTGVLDKNVENQNISIVNYSVDNNDLKVITSDNGIFSKFYKMAQMKLDTLSLDEKIGQILLVRVPEKNKIEDLQKYKFGGYLLFRRDFESKTRSEVVSMIQEFQNASDIPLLIAVDEEGGSVVRVSSNKNLASEPFKSPQTLYQEGGFDLIRKDTINKSNLLQGLGINVNLAPVVDVSMDPASYIYNRTLGLNTEKTSEFAKTVIEASKANNVSYTLKHFPGYGNNLDTHTGVAIDDRDYDEILNDALPPFQAGIEAGAEAVLISHNVVNSIDPDNPASLSTNIHNLLRNKLGFTGVIITDDLSMQAVTDQVTDSAVVKAILAGNDILIVTDYEQSVKEIKEAINDGTLSESALNDMVFRILAWKYYKGMMVDTVK